MWCYPFTVITYFHVELVSVIAKIVKFILVESTLFIITLLFEYKIGLRVDMLVLSTKAYADEASTRVLIFDWLHEAQDQLVKTVVQLVNVHIRFIVNDFGVVYNQCGIL